VDRAPLRSAPLRPPAWRLSPVTRGGHRPRSRRCFRALPGAFAVPLLCIVAALPGALAGQWVEAPGTGWTSFTLYRQSGTSLFDRQAERSRFQNEGKLDATSLFGTVALGVLPGVDMWVQLPVHRLRFDDAGGERTSTGVGDLRLHVRGAPLRLVGWGLPLAVRGGVKIPAGRFPDDIEVVPLGDGQRDWELIVELGGAAPGFWRSYGMLWAGYRWREEQTRRRRDFGNERLALAAGGAEFGPIGVKLQAEGSWGEAPRLEGLLIESARRSLVQLQATVSGPAGPGRWEAGLRVPVAGRNLPADPGLVLGWFSSLDLR
jgi:hypothetical protein